VSARVSVVGSLNMDLVVRVARLPQPGETVAGSEVEYRTGGKGANQAVAAAAAGARVRMVGAVGGDPYGQRLIDGLERRGVGTDDIRAIDASSGIALIVVDTAGQNTITIAPGANGSLSPDTALAALGDLDRIDIVMMQLEVPTAVNLAVARLARERGVRTMLNAAPLDHFPRPDLVELLELCDVLVVNESEARQLLGAALDDWAGAAADLLSLGPAAAVITLGADGAVAVTDDHQLIKQPGFKVDAVDGTGAGDSFCGVLAVSLATDNDWQQALRTACAAGALACTRVGGQSRAATQAEIADFLRWAGDPHAS
jgi:ribokinase